MVYNDLIEHIELCPSHKHGTFRLRIGDVRGAVECSNLSKEDVIKELTEIVEKMHTEIMLRR